MGGKKANWKLEEHVKLPRERKTGRLPAMGKHGKPDYEEWSGKRWALNAITYLVLINYS